MFSVAVICREMKWTYQDYLAQPYPLIKLIGAMLSAEAKHEQQQAKKSK